MEIIAQCLDDLDDLVFAAALALGRLCWPLRLATRERIAVHAPGILAAWIPALAAIALGSVALAAAEPDAAEASLPGETIAHTARRGA